MNYSKRYKRVEKTSAGEMPADSHITDLIAVQTRNTPSKYRKILKWYFKPQASSFGYFENAQRYLLDKHTDFDLLLGKLKRVVGIDEALKIFALNLIEYMACMKSKNKRDLLMSYFITELYTRISIEDDESYE